MATQKVGVRQPLFTHPFAGDRLLLGVVVGRLVAEEALLDAVAVVVVVVEAVVGPDEAGVGAGARRRGGPAMKASFKTLSLLSPF